VENGVGPVAGTCRDRDQVQGARILTPGIGASSHNLQLFMKAAVCACIYVECGCVYVEVYMWKGVEQARHCAILPSLNHPR
jgi:hypothetical protein